MSFHTKIKERRKILGYSQSDLAELSGIGKRTIVYMEKGNYKSKLENWIKVLNILGLEFEIKVRPISYEKGKGKV